MNHNPDSNNSYSKERLNSLRASLVCPICKNKPEFYVKSIECGSCGAKFPQVSSQWISLFPTTLLGEEKQWFSRQQEMESWYKDLIASPSNASACLLSDYTPFTTFLNSLSGKILDVGGGVGLVRHYLSHNTEYTVLDPSLDWLGKEWENLSEIFPCLAAPPLFVQGVGEYIPFPDAQFDAVVSFWSANHCSEPQKFFEEVERVLRPGGTFFIVLEDMVPLWQDLLNPSFPAEEVFQSFFSTSQTSSRFLRLRMLLNLLVKQDFPLQDDHIRISEYDIHEWVKNKFSVVQRTWFNQFLSFEFKKHGHALTERTLQRYQASKPKNFPIQGTFSLDLNLVSVIIPCYRQAHYLGDAIESILAQSYSNYEIIVVDDGSPDNTAEVAAQYPVRYIRQENQGLSGARNTGIRESKGKCLVFLDADDRLTPNALQAGLNCLHAHPECAFISGHHRYIKGDGSLLNEYSPEPIDEDHYLALLKRNYVGMHATVMYQRWVFDVVGGFDTSLKSCEDYDLYLRIAKSFPVYRHDYITAEYRRHESNMTYNSSRMLNAALTALRSQWPYVRDHSSYRRAYCAGLRFWRGYFGKQSLERLIGTLRTGNVIGAIANFMALLKYASPWLSALILELRILVSLLLPKRRLPTANRPSKLVAGVKIE
ncbi:glycosyltransferase [Nodosilinea sp. PGN35]|uniref:glycosyltransferase n=1 Tax=Nodosilinea sp. PGN35 TaxID=3020489 RepID=UPI0023B2BB51|nr:glycosyltransferase [Nodosilinea sp. TSF1-S3]MDF0367328.1 glycosyltransferase [Nodosilinea sp. TSF1-S3]